MAVLHPVNSNHFSRQVISVVTDILKVLYIHVLVLNQISSNSQTEMI